MLSVTLYDGQYLFPTTTGVITTAIVYIFLAEKVARDAPHPNSMSSGCAPIASTPVLFPEYVIEFNKIPSLSTSCYMLLPIINITIVLISN